MVTTLVSLAISAAQATSKLASRQSVSKRGAVNFSVIGACRAQRLGHVRESKAALPHGFVAAHERLEQGPLRSGEAVLQDANVFADMAEQFGVVLKFREGLAGAAGAEQIAVGHERIRVTRGRQVGSPGGRAIGDGRTLHAGEPLPAERQQRKRCREQPRQSAVDRFHRRHIGGAELGCPPTRRSRRHGRCGRACR